MPTSMPAPMPSSAPGPLQGTTVVALEHAIAAPFCTRQLADLGARVIKIERPGVGDFARGYDTRVLGQSSHFIWTNRGKESLSLDLKHPEAQAVLGQLLAQADVLVQNLAPGAAARLGLSFEALHPRWPGLVVCDISGYGQDGPYRDKKAYDLLIQAEAGLLSVTGTAEAPSKAGASMADIAAGMTAYSAVLAALIQRGRTQRGSHIDVSMLESLTEWMGFPLYYAFEGAPPPPRSGAAHASIYPYGPFATGDGGTVLLGVQNEREWRAFCATVLGQPALAEAPQFADNTGRSQHRAALQVLIEAAFAALSTPQVEARLDSAQIAHGRMNAMGEVWRHPQLQARGRWRTVDTPGGPVPALLPPGQHSGFEHRMGPVPALGQHTNAILRELGHSPAQIEALRALGAV